MKNIKLFATIALVAVLATQLSFGLSTTIRLLPGTATNILANFGTYAKVTSASISVVGTTNSSVAFYDAPSATFAYTPPVYTNVISYATNQLQWWTNYFGNTYSNYNIVLMDVTNIVTPAATTYPVRLTLSALANTTTTVGNSAGQANYWFYNGCWLTNALNGISNSPVDVTITFQQ